MIFAEIFSTALAGELAKKQQKYKINFKYRRRAIITRSWILNVHKARILWKNILENKEMAFKNGVVNLQAAGYNCTRTVLKFGLKILSRLEILCF